MPESSTESLAGYESIIPRMRDALGAVFDSLAGSANRARLATIASAFAEFGTAAPADRRAGVTRLLLEIDALRGGASTAMMESERLLLLSAVRGIVASSRLDAVPVSIRLQLLHNWSQLLHTTPRALELFQRERDTFASACDTALLLRWAAGQFDWVRDGLPRLVLLDEGSLRSRASLLVQIMRRLGGFRPVYFPHANGFRHNRSTMVELEARRSYIRMAQALLEDPDVLGIATISWYHDPDLPTISPHLAWMNGIIEEGGGGVVRGGLAGGDSGAFENSLVRREAAERVGYVPRNGIVLWPRARVLAWADRQTDITTDGPTIARLKKMLDAYPSNDVVG